MCSCVCVCVLACECVAVYCGNCLLATICCTGASYYERARISYMRLNGAVATAAAEAAAALWQCGLRFALFSFSAIIFHFVSIIIHVKICWVTIFAG